MSKTVTKGSHPRAKARRRRRAAVRRRVSGTAARPRLAVFRSARHIYAQVINDDLGQTLASASTLDKDVQEKVESDSDKKVAAKHVGAQLAQRCLASNISTVVFDRGGYIYQGRVSALADGAREAGLKF